jgi:phage head maturation protease
MEVQRGDGQKCGFDKVKIGAGESDTGSGQTTYRAIHTLIEVSPLSIRYSTLSFAR